MRHDRGGDVVQQWVSLAADDRQRRGAQLRQPPVGRRLQPALLRLDRRARPEIGQQRAGALAGRRVHLRRAAAAIHPEAMSPRWRASIIFRTTGGSSSGTGSGVGIGLGAASGS